MVKSQFEDKSNTFLGKEDGEQKKILEEVEIFYKTLLQLERCGSYTVAPNMPQLSEEDSALLEGPILYAEAVAAPRHMDNNTSPGPDGFTEEFFMFFSFLILVLFWCVQ